MRAEKMEFTKMSATIEKNREAVWCGDEWKQQSKQKSKIGWHSRPHRWGEREQLHTNDSTKLSSLVGSQIPECEINGVKILRYNEITPI
jgi:hypothetical protein